MDWWHTIIGVSLFIAGGVCLKNAVQGKSADQILGPRFIWCALALYFCVIGIEAVTRGVRV